MADLEHIGGALGRSLWLAANWARMGVRTFAHAGAIIVWRHHVGLLKSDPRNGVALVLSGNDGHRVRERYRSIRGAIAFREL